VIGVGPFTEEQDGFTVILSRSRKNSA